MKSLIIFSLSLFLFSSITIAQTLKNNREGNGSTHHGYFELNFGAAFIKGDLDSPFPGISFLFGQKTYFKNSFILDAEIGLALPSIATAKLGVGYKTKSIEFILGIRPWPTHFYIQTQLSSNQKGGWIMSFEISPYSFNRTDGEPAYKMSMQSLGMVTFGYRWNKRSK